MKAMVLTGIRKMERREVPTPEVVRPTDVRVRIRAVGVCGSDVHYYTTGRIGSQVVQYPFTVGHECAGVVDAVGSGVTRVKPGDAVAIDPAMSCGECDQCRGGRANTCRALTFLGCPGQAEGSLSEFIVMPEACCFRIRRTTSFAQGTLSEPLAIAVYAVKRSIPLAGAAVGILGLGPIGLCVQQAVAQAGATRVFGTDRVPERLTLARGLGVAYAGDPGSEDVVGAILAREPGGLDVVFECCGQQEALDQAIDLLKPGGKLMLIGIPEVERVSFVIDKLRRKEICIQNVRRQEGCVQAALDLIESRAVNLDALVTHHFSLDEVQAAFELLAGYRDGVVKAMIELA
ncbi:MAG: alcohol dehydrogenase catalytic domain-containing protein [Lentisphaerae bacterium]|nr:alcohol dehydrogenase catalytic domain-containing protein [Lentisphaerota bacterium]